PHPCHVRGLSRRPHDGPATRRDRSSGRKEDRLPGSRAVGLAWTPRQCRARYARLLARLDIQSARHGDRKRPLRAGRKSTCDRARLAGLLQCRNMIGSERQSAFSGTREVAERLRFDVARLETYLTEQLPDFAGPILASQFKGGQSNPTYLIETPLRRYVLRRKPP